MLDAAIGREAAALVKDQNKLRLNVVGAPLLGLLGTVTGMIEMFRGITLLGGSDPRLMAGGIAMALVTTLLGLLVAIPLLLGHRLLAARSRTLIEMLERHAARLASAHGGRRQ